MKKLISILFCCMTSFFSQACDPQKVTGKQKKTIYHILRYRTPNQISKLVKHYPFMKNPEAPACFPLVCLNRGVTRKVYPKKPMEALLSAGVPIDQICDEESALMSLGSGVAYWDFHSAGNLD